MSGLPFAPPRGQLPPLPNNAKAAEQFGRLLDALLVLDAEGSCSVSELASRVGLEPARLRGLLSAYMVAGAEALGERAPFTVAWGTADGPLGSGEEHDAVLATADVVHLEGNRARGDWLLGDLGRQPVLVRDVAVSLLAVTLVLEEEPASSDRRPVLQSLAQRLGAALHATVETPADSDATLLQRAVTARRGVRFRYRHPWTGETAEVDVDPYDVWRRRDRVVLAAGTDEGVAIYDVNGISEVVLLDRDVTPADLPPRAERIPQTRVVLAVPDDVKVEGWLLNGWGGKVCGPRPDGRIDIEIQLDGDAADVSAADRLGTLLLQLGPGCSVVEPAELLHAVDRVGARLLSVHPLPAGQRDGLTARQ